MTDEAKREAVLRHCKERGIRVYRMAGEARRLIGEGVDVTVYDLAYLRPADLAPIADTGRPVRSRY
jgi:hypothetical protein